MLLGLRIQPWLMSALSHSPRQITKAEISPPDENFSKKKKLTVRLPALDLSNK
jgi:hypothetical protein